MEKHDFLYDNSAKEVRIYFCRWEKASGPESHALLQRAVEDYLGKRQAEFTVCRDGEHGKPYVRELPDVHVSITHSGAFWACAVAGCEVGLDLQVVREANTSGIAKRFFHPSEAAWLAQHDRDEFFLLWAKKESYAKYTGEGLFGEAACFSVVEGVPACQQELFLCEGYRMVLTTKREAAVSLTKWPDPEGQPENL